MDGPVARSPPRADWPCTPDPLPGTEETPPEPPDFSPPQEQLAVNEQAQMLIQEVWEVVSAVVSAAWIRRPG